MTTAANVRKPDGSHWYKVTGEPMYEIAKKDGSGMRPTTLADARKLNLLPSVTTILKILHKQALVDWMIEQACLALVTAPRLPGEADDAFVTRVLSTERQQDQESQIAKDRGTEIHNAIEEMFLGMPAGDDIAPWVAPVFEAIKPRGKTLEVEYNIVGEGYAGKLDLAQETDDTIWLWDWKSTKKLPDPKKGGAWSEHRLQLSAYAAAWMRQRGNGKPIKTGNVYISTVDCGKFVVCEHQAPWEFTFTGGFAPLVSHWQWANGYRPAQ